MGAVNQGPLNWCRYELKYVIDEVRAAAIANYIRPLVPPDAHGGGSYSLVSLYLDSADMRLCRESLEGVKNRYKLRIRTYDDSPETPRSFEIKSRMNRIIYKSRSWVAPAEGSALLGGERMDAIEHRLQADGNLDRFLYYHNLLRSRPALAVRYSRQAFEGGLGNRLRITFDRNLQYNTSIAAGLRVGNGGWRPYPGRPIILEIKFTGQFPLWLGRMIRHFGLRDQSFSKYAFSVREACARRWCAPRCERILEYV